MLVTRKTKRTVPINSEKDAKKDGSLYQFIIKSLKVLMVTSVFRKFKGNAMHQETQHKQRPDIIFSSEDDRFSLFPPLTLCLIVLLCYGLNFWCCLEWASASRYSICYWYHVSSFSKITFHC